MELDCVAVRVMKHGSTAAGNSFNRCDRNATLAQPHAQRIQITDTLNAIHQYGLSVTTASARPGYSARTGPPLAV